MSDIINQTGRLLGNFAGAVSSWIPSTKEVQTVVIKEVESMRVVPATVFIRIAGLSGAIAVSMGAYGAHAFRESDASEELKRTFETGNRYHLLHTLALLGVPLTRRPNLVGGLLVTGMVLFCGSCYYHALTGNPAWRKVTPYGGVTLIAAWAAMMF